MKRYFLRLPVFILQLCVFAVVVVGICVVHFIIIFVEYLELHKVDTLLDQVYISEMLKMEYKFGDSTEWHNLIFY